MEKEGSLRDGSEHIESDDVNGNQKLKEDLEAQRESSSSSEMHLEGKKLAKTAEQEVERLEGGGKVLRGDVEIQLTSDGCSAGLESREERARVIPFIKTSQGWKILRIQL
ncbi:hypothetical protein V6N11_080474 [Hibiscus sabdariffa]|uniref:Uncharacterized protein n=1 Tax=Hibiscus sabdariffa TaxID=183260 RepID=A0ABR2R7T7_9ROSI